MFAEAEARALRAAFLDAHLDAAVARRASGVPLEQVLGFADLAGARVDVTEGVFVPRERAAAIVDVAAARHPNARVAVDLGCGAGTLAALLTRCCRGARVIGADIDENALSCARRTASRYGFEIRSGSWWNALPGDLRGQIDLAVAYLPHVPTQELSRIHADFRSHEPRSSVDGGVDGLDPLRQVAVALGDWLSPSGFFATLVAPQQVEAAAEVLAAFHVETVRTEDDVVLLASHLPGR